jgi:transposase
MLHLPSSMRIFLCLEPSDMRKSFDGLCALTHQVLKEDPLNGALFVFRNRRRDRVKLLYWDGDGLVIWYKRLEKGSFVFPPPPTDESEEAPAKLQVRARELMLLLEGVDLKSVRRQRRYALPQARPEETV